MRSFLFAQIFENNSNRIGQDTGTNGKAGAIGSCSTASLKSPLELISLHLVVKTRALWLFG